MYEFMFGAKPDELHYIYCLYHVNINRAENHRFLNPMIKDIAIITKFSIGLSNIKNIMKMGSVQEAFKQLKEQNEK